MAEKGGTEELLQNFWETKKNLWGEMLWLHKQYHTIVATAKAFPHNIFLKTRWHEAPNLSEVLRAYSKIRIYFLLSASINI